MVLSVLKVERKASREGGLAVETRDVKKAAKILGTR